MSIFSLKRSRLVHLFISVFYVLFVSACTSDSKNESQGYQIAPFDNLDTLSTNDWWNRGENRITNLKVGRDSVVAFGIYTVQNRKLKLSAQLYPLYPAETREVRLELFTDGDWREVQSQQVNELGWSALFTIEGWNDQRDVRYRIRHGEMAAYEGLIRKIPNNKEEIIVASLSCNSKWGDKSRENYVRNINFQNPDLVFFAGDQSYEHTEHTAAWILFGLQFREVFRERPCIVITDDHDIGQANLWGEGGKKSKIIADDEGGYHYHPAYVNMVQRCQMAHLPDPFDPTPIDQGIEVYYTRYELDGIDFAILEDRKWKSSPKGNVPVFGERADHIGTPDYDPKSLDKEGLVLLGDRQISFLENWSSTNVESAFKVVLSQTGFSSGVHLHGTRENRLYVDLDANAWPQTGRNKALKVMKEANAIHLAGDQHLGTVYQNGIETYDDGPWTFLSPAIVNSVYGRWWEPLVKDEKSEINNDLPFTGKYKEGLGNKLTMHAYANPEQGGEDRGAGYGLIRFNKTTSSVTFECWPRSVDVSKDSAEQYEGWPITVKMTK